MEKQIKQIASIAKANNMNEEEVSKMLMDENIPEEKINEIIEGVKMEIAKSKEIKELRRTSRTGFAVDPSLSCTKEQADFAELVNKNKGKLYNQLLTHRGVNIQFGGAGRKTLRYLVAFEGLSDKEELEYVPLYLDWDDTALEDEGGIRDQIQEILGKETRNPDLIPIRAQKMGE